MGAGESKPSLPSQKNAEDEVVLVDAEEVDDVEVVQYLCIEMEELRGGNQKQPQEMFCKKRCS